MVAYVAEGNLAEFLDECARTRRWVREGELARCGGVWVVLLRWGGDGDGDWVLVYRRIDDACMNDISRHYKVFL